MNIHFSGQPLVSSTNNLIDGNTVDAISISCPSASNVIQRNFIGVAADGTPRPTPMSLGIFVCGEGANVIGGTGAGMGNVIAYKGTGIDNFGGGNNRFLGNSIYANSGLGIDYRTGSGGRGPTKNDPADTDKAQNFPIIGSATRNGLDVQVTGTLNSTANTAFRIELFANNTVDPSGYGEGQFYLGFTNVTTDAAGNASFDVTLSGKSGANALSATATGPARGTSEFSPSFFPGKLENISTRGHVQSGDRVMIGGFIISGSEPRRVILRSVGPSLAVGGVPFTGRLEDPVLELFDQGGVRLATNDNWRETQQAEIEQTGIPPQHEREPAIVRTLAPGSYTAAVSGRNGTTGVAVVEVYDLRSDAVSRLGNISTRAFVEAGEKVMIGGFIIGREDGRARVLVRGIGPSVAGTSEPVLQDPILELYDANGALLTSNDDWRTNEAQIEATGAPPRNDRESAFVADLPAGSYTTVLRGKAETTGVALVEVYHLQ